MSEELGSPPVVLISDREKKVYIEGYKELIGRNIFKSAYIFDCNARHLTIKYTAYSVSIQKKLDQQ